MTTDRYVPTSEDRFSFGIWTGGWQGVDVFGGATRFRADPEVAGALRGQGVLDHLGVAGGPVRLMREFVATGEFDAVLSRVNALSPGPTDTRGFANFAGERGDEFRTHLAEVIPVGRIGRPEEVASAALFLACAESSFIAGAELVMDGGMSQI